MAYPFLSSPDRDWRARPFAVRPAG